MGMDFKYYLGELLHMFKRFLKMFYEMVVVVTKEGNVWYSVKKQNAKNKPKNKLDSCFIVWCVRGKFGFFCWGVVGSVKFCGW